MRLGFLGLPIDRSKGPRRNFQEISEGCDAAWAAWSSGSKVFPGSCLMLLNVINPWDVRASLLKETGRATGEVALSTYTHVFTHVKINQHTLLASTIPWHILSMLYIPPMLSLRVEPIWFASDLEDAWLVLRKCIPPFDLRL